MASGLRSPNLYRVIKDFSLGGFRPLSSRVSFMVKCPILIDNFWTWGIQGRTKIEGYVLGDVGFRVLDFWGRYSTVGGHCCQLVKFGCGDSNFVWSTF